MRRKPSGFKKTEVRGGGEIGEEDDGDQDADAKSELQGIDGLAAECKANPRTGEARLVDRDNSGSGEYSNLLTV